MGKRTNPALVGAFVLGAIGLLVVAVMVWGSGRLFERAYPFVCYFPGSVNGLTIGAPVKFRGVQIGSVTDIRLRYAQERGEPRIPVFIKVEPETVSELGAEDAAHPSSYKELVARGLRARLQTQSLVTGVLYVELDLEPDSPLDLVQAEGTGTPEIPTLPTALEEATRSISDILAQLKAVDFKGISKGVTDAIDGVQHLVHSPDLQKTLAAPPDTVEGARRLVASLDTRTGTLTVSLQQTSEDARRAVDSLRATLDDVRVLVAPEAPLAVELSRSIGDLGAAARALRDLADYLERN